MNNPAFLLEDQDMSIKDIRFSQMTTFGDQLYRRKGQIAEILMENNRTGVRKTIVDDEFLLELRCCFQEACSARDLLLRRTFQEYHWFWIFWL